MPAPKMLSGLPKPVLFGLYGAIGGLIGALAFGELLWFLLRPPPPKPPEPRLAVSASKDLQIYQGGTNKLFVQIARDAFADDVVVRVDGLPTGVSAGEVTIPAKQTEAEIDLRAAASAASSTTPLKVVATAKSGGKELTALAELNLTTLPVPMPQADIVFVLDVTGSMQQQINGLQRGIGTFARDLAAAKVDARFGCVCFRDFTDPADDGLKRMEVLMFKGQEFTATPEDFSGEVRKQRANGGGDISESSFEAISEAAKYKEWRKSASRVLILITDAPPKVDPQGIQKNGNGQSVKQTIDDLRDNRIDLLHLVIGNDDPALLKNDPRINERMQRWYRDVQQGAIGVSDKDGSTDKGKEFNLPQVARTPDEMTRVLLPEMSKAIVAAAEVKRPDSKPELGAKPEQVTIKGVQSSDTYDAGSSGRLVLAVGVWTGSIAALVCLFLLSGQHHYLRGSLPPIGGVLAGLGGGLLVGTVGGAAGQGLFLVAPDNAILQAIFRVMGWTILGSMAGAGLSLFVPNLKLVYGLVGGAIGGAVGALGYLAVSYVAGALLGRLAGGLVLGLFIGLMVAIVEAAFRRAWLEVRYGPREVVTVNLGAEPVKVGSDSRSCTVWARGAPKVALRYFIRDGQVICTDVPSREEEVVVDGDTREAGNVTVVVRTGSGNAPSAPPARRPAPPPVPRAKPKPAPPPKVLELDDDGDVLPLPITELPPPPPPARPAPAAAPPARPPLPAASRPPVPAPAAPPRPASPPLPTAPAVKPTARDPDACPSCGRKNAGRPGARYCMVCDITY